MRSSRSSLDNEIFKSELSLVLQNRRQSETENSGFENPAFQPEVSSQNTDITSGKNDVATDDGTHTYERENSDSVVNEDVKAAAPNVELTFEANTDTTDLDLVADSVAIQKEEGKYKTVLDVTSNTGGIDDV